MIKIQWDKLPIGTVVIWKASIQNNIVNWIHVKLNNKEYLNIHGLDDGKKIIDDSGDIWDVNYENCEVAPKWIQELFKIK